MASAKCGGGHPLEKNTSIHNTSVHYHGARPDLTLPDSNVTPEASGPGTTAPAHHSTPQRTTAHHSTPQLTTPSRGGSSSSSEIVVAAGLQDVSGSAPFLLPGPPGSRLFPRQPAACADSQLQTPPLLQPPSDLGAVHLRLGTGTSTIASRAKLLRTNSMEGLHNSQRPAGRCRRVCVFFCFFFPAALRERHSVDTGSRCPPPHRRFGVR
jgi:hypothetical protein